MLIILSILLIWILFHPTFVCTMVLNMFQSVTSLGLSFMTYWLHATNMHIIRLHM